MSRNDFFDIEDRIRNAVDSAFHYVDNYQDIKHSALNEVRNHLKRSTNFAQDTFENVSRMYKDSKEDMKNDTSYNHLGNFNWFRKKNVSPYIAKRPAGLISGVLFSMLGALGSIGSGIVTFVMLIGIFGFSDSIIFICVKCFQLVFLLYLYSFWFWHLLDVILEKELRDLRNMLHI